MAEVWLTARQLAKRQQRDLSRIYRSLGDTSKVPPHYAFGERTIRFKLSDVEKWEESRRAVGAAS